MRAPGHVVSRGTVSEIDRWFPAMRDVADPRCRLFCFPYAGASATVYAPWAAYLAGVDVRALQLPGRGSRAREASLTCVTAVVDSLMPALCPLLDRPFALFGHSMGAQLAFETTRRLQRLRLPAPVHLFVSGRRAPQIPDDDLPRPDSPDAEFLDALRELNGTPAELLDNAELMTLLLPSLRADFGLVRLYSYMPGPPLTCPITVFGGADDEESTPVRVEGWRAHTTGHCDVRQFPGGHFFVHTAAESLLAALDVALHRSIGDDACRPSNGSADG